MSSDRCNSFHSLAGCTCVREKGHDGLCWSKAVPNREAGSITRCEWRSENGVFKGHYQYATRYPNNASLTKEGT